MKLRKVINPKGPQVQAIGNGAWVSLSEIPTANEVARDNGVKSDLSVDTLAVLRLGRTGWSDLQAEINKHDPTSNTDGIVTIPFEPHSFRDFMLFEKHVIDATRGYVRRFMPGMYKVTSLIEKLTRRPFPKFRPHPLWYKQPIYYFGNHTNFLANDQRIPWPPYSNALDYELELGAVLAQPLLDASPSAAEDAIGGFVVLNDVSARDVQTDEMNSGFGPQKAKHFINFMSDTLVTADEILPRLSSLTGSVSINGKRVATCSLKDMQYSFGEVLAFASKGEQLHPGELFGTGTLPGGSGMENGYWVNPGDSLSLGINGVGVVSNIISEKRCS